MMENKSITPPKIILMDLDGTLVDNSEYVVNAYYDAMEYLGYTPKDRDFIATLAGKSTVRTAEALGIREEDWGYVTDYFWDYFRGLADDNNRHSKVFDKVIDFLELSVTNNIKLGVVTSNMREIASKILQKEGLIKYIDVIVGAEDVNNKKPSAEPIKLALNRLNVDHSEKIWFVGDTASDVGSAKNAGVISFAIPQKHTFYDVLDAKPDFLLDSFADLYEFLKMLLN